MATLIKLKRKKSSGNAGVVLAAGEAYYNLQDKHLYVGNHDGEDALTKKHIAEITPIDAGPTTVKFQLGEDENNYYEKKITADAIEGVINDAVNSENVTSSINGQLLTSIFESNGTTVKKAKSATSADSVVWKNFK